VSTGPISPLGRLTRTLAKAPIYVYRYSLKAVLGNECRYLPTCSQYALDAIELNGAWRGAWLAFSRLTRCRPGARHGYDPAPDIRGERYVLTPWRYGRWR
jgi:putative membrane protein insertion efficiency factor